MNNDITTAYGENGAAFVLFRSTEVLQYRFDVSLDAFEVEVNGQYAGYTTLDAPLKSLQAVFAYARFIVQMKEDRRTT